MRIKEIQIETNTLDKSEGAIYFSWSEILLEDLENYTDDITVDGDSHTLEFYIG